ncbi:sensor histidine kinase [Microlunatus ginsengisoli]|uniref:sensor histidine kinase n=1 Tax=Microlunatus ginsengisoli TaxID=363863 RepID=UPI0031D1DAE1
MVDELASSTGPLRVGDCVVAVDGVPLEALIRDRPGHAYHVGDIVRYQIRRSGTSASSQCTGPLTEVSVVLDRYRPAVVLGQHPSVLPLAVCLLALGSFLVAVRPRLRATRALLIAACLFPFGMTEWPFGTQVVDLAAHRLWPFVIGDTANALFWGALLLMAVSLPRRQLPRWVVAGCFVGPLGLHLLYLTATLPGHTSGLARLARLVTVSLAAAYTVPLLMVIGLLTGYRDLARDEKRRAVRWVLVPFTFAAVCYLGLGQIPAALTNRPLVPWTWLYGMFLLVLVALAISVVRNHLFEVRVIIRRWALRVLTLLTGVVIAVGGSQLLVPLPTGIPTTWAAAAIGVTAFGACVLISRVERVLQRKVFGARADNATMLSALAPPRGAPSSNEDGLAATLEALREALRLAFVRLELTMPGMPPLILAAGTHHRPELVLPLRADSAVLGQLSLAVRPGLEPLGHNDERLIDALGQILASHAYNVGLQHALRQALARAVTAREDERRRVRREIHDGIGPLLAAALLRTELAAPTAPPTQARTFNQLRELQQTALSDLRHLVEGLRPPALDHGGLDTALRQHANLSVTGHPCDSPEVVIQVSGDLTDLPAAIEVAAYRIGQEAITNATRHAHARHIDVRLERSPGSLVVQVSDDGRGVPKASNIAGVGMVSMRERATELGGEYITETLTPGTRIRAQLPIVLDLAS